ncbi:hypothetical protein M0R45_036420 [Rubus argutus]|uniref:Uncharacterized protein n=1 Tax=Rubus argutus TaxID=59490 RepID=A0AAW1VYS2_RUBAR
MSLQDYEFCLGMIQGAMVSQQQSQAQCYESPNPVLDESIPQWQIEFDKWEHEFEERIARTSKLLEELSATIDVNCLLEQDQELTIQHPSKLNDSDSLLVHDDIDVHSFGAKREENVPLSHVAINNVHHNTALKEDGNREEENELPGNGLDHDTVLSRSKKRCPAYAEFVKNLTLHKRKFQADEKFILKEEVSAIIQRRVSPNIHDPMSFAIGCAIGDNFFKGALMDIGTPINIMPLATFRKLEIGTLMPTSISMQLADETFRMPVGIVEDVLVRVDKFILPADFVILDMDEDPKIESRLPIILGRTFMAMAGAKINVQKGTVKLKVLGEKIKLQVLQPTFPQNIIKEVFSTDLVMGNQAKSERIFGPLNPPEPLIQDHPLPVIEEQVSQEPSFKEDYFDDFDDDDVANLYGVDDKVFAISISEVEPSSSIASLTPHKIETSSAGVTPNLDMDPYSSDPETSSFIQVHKLKESTTTLQRQEVVQPTSTILERERGILPTPYVPPHRRGLLPTPYFHPHEQRFSSLFESLKMRSPSCCEVQFEAIQCLRDILGIGVNRVMTHEWYPNPFSSCKSMAAPYMSCYGGRQMYFAPP